MEFDPFFLLCSCGCLVIIPLAPRRVANKTSRTSQPELDGQCLNNAELFVIFEEQQAREQRFRVSAHIPTHRQHQAWSPMVLCLDRKWNKGKGSLFMPLKVDIQLLQKIAVSTPPRKSHQSTGFDITHVLLGTFSSFQVISAVVASGIPPRWARSLSPGGSHGILEWASQTKTRKGDRSGGVLTWLFPVSLTPFLPTGFMLPLLVCPGSL